MSLFIIKFNTNTNSTYCANIRIIFENQKITDLFLQKTRGGLKNVTDEKQLIEKTECASYMEYNH